MLRQSFKVVEANVLFLLAAILFITLGASAQSWDVHKGLLITEYGVILTPVIIAGFVLKIDMKKALKLNKIKLRTIIRLMAVSFLIIPTVALVNLIPITILSHFNKVIIPEIPSPTSPMELLTSLFIIAVSAGICEEVFFRGLILNAYETAYNKKTGAIMAAILFGVFHFNIQNLFGPIVIGLVAAYVMQITNSIYSAIVLHMTNNGIAVLSDYLLRAMSPEMIETSADAASINGNTTELLTSITMLFIIASIGVFIVKVLINGLKRDTFYYALGEPFTMGNQAYYLVDKTPVNGRIISKKSAFESGTYNLSAEKNVAWSSLNAGYPKRVHEIWEEKDYSEQVDLKVFAPVAGVFTLYVYLLYQFLTYVG